MTYPFDLSFRSLSLVIPGKYEEAGGYPKAAQISRARCARLEMTVVEDEDSE